MNREHRTFPSTPDAVADAMAFAEETATAWGRSPAVVDALCLFLGEAVANAAVHGNRLDPERQVEVSLASDEAALTCCVQDEGEGIPEERVLAPSLPEDPLGTSGRGLFIIHELADAVWLEAEGRRLCARFAEG